MISSKLRNNTSVARYHHPQAKYRKPCTSERRLEAGAEWMQKRIQDESDFWHDVGTPPPFYGHYLVELSNGMVVSDTFDGEEWCYGGTLVKRWLDVYELKKL